MQQTDETQNGLSSIRITPAGKETTSGMIHITPDVVSFPPIFVQKIHNFVFNGSLDSWTTLVDWRTCNLATNPRVTWELDGVYVQIPLNHRGGTVLKIQW